MEAAVRSLETPTAQLESFSPIDGALLSFVEHTDGKLALLRRVGGRSVDTEVLLLDPHDGTLRSVEPLGDLSAATSPALVSSADAVYVDEAVEMQEPEEEQADGPTVVMNFRCALRAGHDGEHQIDQTELEQWLQVVRDREATRG